MRIFSELENQANHMGGAQTSQELEPAGLTLASVKATLALASVKGGTGKSALAISIAAALALAGKRVGILDADLNAPSILQMLGMKAPRQFHSSEGIEPASGPLGIRVVSAEFISEGQPPPISFVEEQPQPSAPSVSPVELGLSDTLRRLLAQSRFANLDLLIIDLAPGVENLYRFVKTAPPSGVILVSHPSANAARAMRRAFERNSAAGAALLGVVENMVGFSCDHCRSVRPLFPDGEVSRIAREAGLPIVARLPFDPRFAESSDRGKVFVSEYPDSPMAKQLIAMARQIETLLADKMRHSAASAPSSQD